MKLYRVNASEHFNLESMREKLLVHLQEMECGEREWDESIYSRIGEIDDLCQKAYGPGALVDWPTLKRVREIQAERQFLRYSRSMEAGKTECEAAISFRV